MKFTLPISHPDFKKWLAPRVLVRIICNFFGEVIDMIVASDKNFSEFGEGQCGMCVYEKMFRVYIISRCIENTFYKNSLTIL